MTSGGGAWDNAKKAFEDGVTDDKGVFIRKAATDTKPLSQVIPSAIHTRIRPVRLSTR